jgi:hypothetical protein
MKVKTLVGSLACVLMLSGIAFAHHGSGLTYQMDKELTIKGTVTEFRWANPHSQLYFDVNDGGNVVHWAVEMGSPGVLSRMGVWQRNTLKPGDVVSVTYHPSKSGEPVGHCITMIQPGGRRVGCYATTIEDIDKGAKQSDQ